MTVLQGPTWTGPFMSIHTILLTMPQPYPPKIPHLCHCLRAFALAISSAWNILFQILMWFMVEFSSFKFSAKISFRDLWPSVVNLYGANIAKLLIGSSELYLHNSRIVWIKEVFGMRLRGLRESNHIQTLLIVESSKRGVHCCFLPSLLLICRFTFLVWRPKARPTEHQLHLSHLRQFLWLLGQMCVLLCDKGCWVLQDNPVIEVGDLKAMRLAWVPGHPHKFHSVLVGCLILAGPSASLLSPLHIHFPFSLQFSSVQLLNCIWLLVTLCTATYQASLSFISQSLLKLMSIESVMPSNHLILCRPLFLPPSIFPSIRVFSNESVLRIRWPKYWSFTFSVSPFNEYSGLISFGMDWLDLLAVQGTLKSLLQHHSSKASILCSAFFIVQLWHPYMTTGKTTALTRQTLFAK